MRSWLLVLALVGCDRTPDAVEVCDGLVDPVIGAPFQDRGAHAAGVVYGLLGGGR